jgi:hypothetical protein
MSLKQQQQRIDMNVYFVREKDLQVLLNKNQTTVNLVQEARIMSAKAFFEATGLEKKSQSFTHQDWGECYVWVSSDFAKIAKKEDFPINEIEIISEDFSLIVENFNGILEEKDNELSEKDAKIAELERKIAAMSAPKKRVVASTTFPDTTSTTEQ